MNELQQQAKALQHDYRSTLQGALVYDPELIEANEALANLLVKDIIQAVANGAVKERKLHRKTSPKVSTASTKNKQQTLLDMLHHQCTDDIVLMKARQGDFIGRQQTRTQIVRSFKADSRLVSLVGTAGVGKTRLALETISGHKTPDLMTCFCNLTEATSDLGIHSERSQSNQYNSTILTLLLNWGYICKTRNHFGTRQSRTSHRTHQKGDHSMDESIRYYVIATSQSSYEWMKKPVFKASHLRIGMHRSIH